MFREETIEKVELRKAKRIIAEYIVNDKIIKEYTIGNYKKRVIV